MEKKKSWWCVVKYSRSNTTINTSCFLPLDAFQTALLFALLLLFVFVVTFETSLLMKLLIFLNSELDNWSLSAIWMFSPRNDDPRESAALLSGIWPFESCAWLSWRFCPGMKMFIFGCMKAEHLYWASGIVLVYRNCVTVSVGVQNRAVSGN